MKIIRQIYMIAAAIGISLVMYYLYQRQLGAISFFILSIIFFILGFRMLGKKEKGKSK
ncbi:YitT family protein [Bacillus sp. CGMCC 1.16607]|uniref:YitT family protein n=1 Tax=Bacillus sp. CGMCC 1.16607 TaxID=3351842 RepID=UPI00363052F0